MEELNKKYIVIHKNNIISVKETNFTGRCYPGNGFDSAEFDTEESLNEYIKSLHLISRDEAITKVAVLNNQIVDTEKYLYDARLFDNKEAAEEFIQFNQAQPLLDFE